ncbi:hypothetical protein CEUSTIGMA_g13980.t1 [Chlamydomonas eustigma]|uniref:Uncharacterized protein n=1 Tax=Chlamydomonas eustigma TaxID=1157962 RepID=A0A250XU77_9CHLO|nr:hypothetical protein CEUSTIGMA_g13980.t1 [Chlamydomonas eustigma]|eukprot:GAX86573.1 hypothetical protein CEUSTIGMA_g13980.t1 [Chlamydomonas eustigma]
MSDLRQKALNLDRSFSIPSITLFFILCGIVVSALMLVTIRKDTYRPVKVNCFCQICTSRRSDNGVCAAVSERTAHTHWRNQVGAGANMPVKHERWQLYKQEDSSDDVSETSQSAFLNTRPVGAVPATTRHDDLDHHVITLDDLATTYPVIDIDLPLNQLQQHAIYNENTQSPQGRVHQRAIEHDTTLQRLLGRVPCSEMPISEIYAGTNEVYDRKYSECTGENLDRRQPGRDGSYKMNIVYEAARDI